MPLTPVITEHWDDPTLYTIDGYKRYGGYRALESALKRDPDSIIGQIKDSGLRGRGGAGFPTGLKWSFVPQNDGKDHYLVVNADESEPGACKDIPIMLANPHSLVEGVIITSFAIRAPRAFIYIRGEVPAAIRRVAKAVRDAYDAGYIGSNILGTGYDLEVVVHAGAGAYICGEETALLDSLEGYRGQPRLKPPFPAVAGLYASPTVINNVETICNIPFILDRGVDWFRQFGTEKSPGFKVFAISGHVVRPGIYEAPLGITMRELLDYAGGMRDGRDPKFWLPGGSSVPMLTAEHLDVPMTYEDMAAAGTMLGTGTPMLFDSTVSVVKAVTRWLEFYKHESCGKCTPCREGTYWITGVLDKFEEGRGTASELDLLVDVCGQISGRSFCALGDAAATPYPAALKYFREEFETAITTPADEQFDPVASYVFAGGGGSMTITNNPGTEVEVQVDLITVVVDGVELRVPKGTLAIRAAEMLGVEVPRFCDHPLLDPVAACRACLIEIDGVPKPQPACAQVLAEGMNVHTQYSSEVARKAQEGVMEFLLLNHPLDCPMCDKGGECPLQNQAMAVGRPETRFTEEKRTFPKPINVSAQVLLDRERCVSCARCTRFADQIAGDPFIDLLERGSKQQVGIAEGEPFDSYFSGNTVQICPVGALTSAAYRFRSRPFDLVSVPTVCEHCASGCSLRTDHRRGRVMRRLAWDDPAVNEEWNCDKGRFAFPYLDEGRIEGPLIRENGELRPASWPEAMDVVARGLSEAGAKSGVLVGGRATVEDAYAYARFARVALGTDNVDFRARLSSAEEAQFLAAAVAGRPVHASYDALEHAPVVLLVSLDVEDEAPIVFLRLRKASRNHGTTVVQIGSMTTVGLEKMGGRLVATKPGDDSIAIAALDAETRGLLSQPGAVILVGERAAGSPGALSAVARLADETGAALAWVPRRAGERGALDAGALAGLLPGGRPLTDPEARDQVADAWGIDPAELPSSPGLSGTDLLAAAAAGQITALVVGGVELQDFPDAELARAAVSSAAFVVSLENHFSEVTDLADVVLPVAVVTEKSGSFFNWEGRPRLFSQVFREALTMSDARVLALMADALGVRMAGEVSTIRQEIGALGAWTGSRTAAPDIAPEAGNIGGIRLDGWRQLLDSGLMQEGEPYLAATARPTVARLSATTAAENGIDDVVTVTGANGSVTLEVVVADVVDGVVWLPLNSPGCHVYADLGAVPGDVVTIAAGSTS